MANGDNNLNFGPFESQQAEENPQNNERFFSAPFPPSCRRTSAPM